MSRRPGFTLVELLVVISIVALLVSILLPALGQAREAGMNVSCLARMHQIYLYTTAYQADNHNYYVANHFYNGNAVGLSYDEGYFGYQIKPYLPKSLNNINNYNCNPSNNFLLCPNTTYRYKNPPSAVNDCWPHIYAGNGMEIGYEGTMQFGGGNAFFTTIPNREKYFPKNRLNRRYPIPYFMELKGNTPYMCYTSVGNVMYNHYKRTSTNVAYDDGHAKSWGENLQAAYVAGRFPFW